MAQVFISFISEDNLVAAAVQQLLQKTLHLKNEVFLSSVGIIPGQYWLDQVRQALDESKVIVLMLSRRSVKRPWVNFEAGAAWLAKKTLVPCCFGALTKKDLPPPYSAIQALRLPGDSTDLVSSVAFHLGLPPPPPRLVGFQSNHDPYDPYDHLSYHLEQFKDES